MPLLFIHGVNNRREDAGYLAKTKLTERLFAAHFAGMRVNGKVLGSATPAFPYWGDLATRFAWDMASLPSGEVDALGGAVAEEWRPLVAAVEDALGTLAQGEDNPLLALARRSLGAAVEMITDIVLLAAPATDDDASLVAEFVAEAQELAEAPGSAWVDGATTDEQLIAALMAAVSARRDPGADALGGPFARVGNWVRAGAARLRQGVRSAAGTAVDRAGDYASTKMLAWARSPLNATLGRFFGDVFAYFDERGTRDAPGPIPARILAALDAAVAAAPPGDPLVVVGHSLGGVISYDLFSHFRPDLPVDLFVTVGSQVSHFEEMKRFRVSDPAIRGPQGRAPRSPNIAHWINVFDRVDIFSYACARVFDRVVDFEYDTKTFTIKAHGAYFDQTRFYKRLRARVDALQ